MEGIAAAANVSLDSIVLSNLLYELTTGCTSIIARKSNNGKQRPMQQQQQQQQPLIHGRNLDYSLDPNNPDLLRQETIDVEFQKGGYRNYVGMRLSISDFGGVQQRE